MKHKEVLNCIRCTQMYNSWDLNDDGVCYRCEDDEEEPARLDWDDTDTIVES